MATYSLKPGFAWNPLRAHRNIICLCGSGHKAKRCCGRTEVLPEDVARKVAAALRAMKARAQ